MTGLRCENILTIRINLMVKKQAKLYIELFGFRKYYSALKIKTGSLVFEVIEIFAFVFLIIILPRRNKKLFMVIRNASNASF